MRLEWNQRQNSVKILNCLHINFQKQILKGKLSINQWKSRSLDHNNYFSGAVFDFEIKSSAIPRIHFCVPSFFEYLLFACLLSLELFLVVTFNSFCVVLFFLINLFLALILWPLNLVVDWFSIGAYLSGNWLEWGLVCLIGAGFLELIP